jgi:hypothetical protein
VTARVVAGMTTSVERTGAVIMGRRAFEMGDPDWYAGVLPPT